MEKYYVIHNGDGDTTVEELTKEQLMERVNDDGLYYGQPFLDEIPKESDTNYWSGYPLIIKGHVVSPKPIKIVEEFEIE